MVAAAAMAAARPRSTQLPPGSEMPGGFARGDRDCGEALVTMVAGPADMGGLPSPGSAVWRADDGGDDGGDTDIRGDEEAAGEDGERAVLLQRPWTECGAHGRSASAACAITSGSPGDGVHGRRIVSSS